MLIVCLLVFIQIIYLPLLHYISLYIDLYSLSVCRFKLIQLGVFACASVFFICLPISTMLVILETLASVISYYLPFSSLPPVLSSLSPHPFLLLPPHFLLLPSSSFLLPLSVQTDRYGCRRITAKHHSLEDEPHIPVFRHTPRDGALCPRRQFPHQLRGILGATEQRFLANCHSTVQAKQFECRSFLSWDHVKEWFCGRRRGAHYKEGTRQAWCESRPPSHDIVGHL